LWLHVWKFHGNAAGTQAFVFRHFPVFFSVTVARARINNAGSCSLTPRAGRLSCFSNSCCA
jgi:hypothetical protein